MTSLSSRPDPTPGFPERLWGVVGAVSVRTKILGIVLGLVLLLGLGITAQVRVTLTQTLERQLQEQSISIARDVAARATDLILVNDVFGLFQLLRETQQNNLDLRYAFVVDTEGRVLAHTFGPGFPAGLLEANAVAAQAHHQIKMLATDDGPVWDTAVPIFDGRAGVARIALSEAGLRRAVDATTGQLLITTVLVSIIGITAAGFLTWLLTRPIVTLATAANAVAKGDLSQQVRRWADDEIGDLSSAFNSMTDSLAKAGEERAEREHLRERYVKAVIAAQEDERKRIARELHDGTSQSITSLMIGLRALGDCGNEEMKRRAEELRGVATRTLDEVHALSLQLRPSVLDDLGLAAAVERYVADCRKRTDITFDLAMRGLDDQRLPSEVETAVYRIVQEAITNVLRHARASAASVMIERRDGALRAIVEDDGQGFEIATAGKADQRLGLFGMRERAELLGGTLTIESQPGRGASIFIEIPTGDARWDSRRHTGAVE